MEHKYTEHTVCKYNEHTGFKHVYARADLGLGFYGMQLPYSNPELTV